MLRIYLIGNGRRSNDFLQPQIKRLLKLHPETLRYSQPTKPFFPRTYSTPSLIYISLRQSLRLLPFVFFLCPNDTVVIDGPPLSVLDTLAALLLSRTLNITFYLGEDQCFKADHLRLVSLLREERDMITIVNDGIEDINHITTRFAHLIFQRQSSFLANLLSTRVIVDRHQISVRTTSLSLITTPSKNEQLSLRAPHTGTYCLWQRDHADGKHERVLQLLKVLTSAHRFHQHASLPSLRSSIYAKILTSYFSLVYNTLKLLPFFDA